MRTLSVIFFAFVLLSSCNNQPKTIDGFMVLKGKTMGAKYEIAYKSPINYQKSIDSLFDQYIQLLSLYDSNSIISKFNHNKALTEMEWFRYNESKANFTQLDSVSKKLNEESEGLFNTGLGDLYNYWGVGETQTFPKTFDQTIIDSFKSMNWGFNLSFDSIRPFKVNSNQKLNFNSLAVGQIIDLLAQKFDSVYHLKNYYINIGGKIRVKGNNGHDSYWPIIIEKPMINSLKQIEFCTLPLKNYSLSSSSNLKDFNFSQGQRFSQYINPISGFPAKNELLSVTIIAPTAIEASGYSSTCMVLGLQKSIELIQKSPFLKAFIIFEKEGKIEHWESSNLAYKMAKKSE